MTAAQIESMMTERMNKKFPWDERSSGKTVADVKEDVFALTSSEVANVSEYLSTTPMPKRCFPAWACSATTARTYILNNTRRRFVINESGPRTELPELPTRAVKEALMNAYAHCDWTRGGCVQIDIYYDTVEILSLGWFVEGQDPEEHLSGESVSSQGRNKLIAQTMYRSGDIEAYGTGIPRMRDLCDGVGVHIEYIKVPEGTKLVFHRSDAFIGNIADNLPIIADKLSTTADINRPWDGFSTCCTGRKQEPNLQSQRGCEIGFFQE